MKKFNPFKTIKILLRIVKAYYIRKRVSVLKSDPVKLHFKHWSEKEHINYAGFVKAVSMIRKDRVNLFETGTSAYGIDSTRLLDLLAIRLKGHLISVDLSPKPKRSLKYQLSRHSKLYVCDSVLFIEEELRELMPRIDFAYLDSWDVDWSNGVPSAKHGLLEFTGIRPMLSVGSIVIIDDTPATIDLVPKEYQDKASSHFGEHGYLPGKGSLVLNLVNRELAGEFEIIHHSYNLVLQKIA